MHIQYLLLFFTFRIEVGKMMHECESEMVCTLIEKDSKIPYFNAGIYLENKRKIGKVDEVSQMKYVIVFLVQKDHVMLRTFFSLHLSFFE